MLVMNVPVIGTEKLSATKAFAPAGLTTHRTQGPKNKTPKSNPKNQSEEDPRPRRKKSFQSKEPKKIQTQENGISNRQLFSTFIPPLTIGKHFGSIVSPKEIIKLANEAIRVPPANTKQILSEAMKGPVGRPAVVDYHLSLLREQNMELIQNLKHNQEILIANTEGLMHQIREVTVKLRGLEQYRVVGQESSPWTISDGIQVTAYAVTLLGLAFVEWNTMPTLVWKNGLAPTLAAARVFCAIPLAFPIGLKGLRSKITTESKKGLFNLVVWVIGILTGIIWIVLSAQKSQGLSIDNLVNGTLADSGWATDTSILIFQVLASSFISAGCFLTALDIIDKHQHSVVSENSEYRSLEKKLQDLVASHSEQKSLLGKIEGKFQAFAMAESRFAQEVGSLFDKADASYSTPL